MRNRGLEGYIGSSILENFLRTIAKGEEIEHIDKYNYLLKIQTAYCVDTTKEIMETESIDSSKLWLLSIVLRAVVSKCGINTTSIIDVCCCNQEGMEHPSIHHDKLNASVLEEFITPENEDELRSTFTAAMDSDIGNTLKHRMSGGMNDSMSDIKILLNVMLFISDDKAEYSKFMPEEDEDE